MTTAKGEAKLAEIKIEQRPDEDETVIEGTVYHNDFLRHLGQTGIGDGPFVVTSRGDGVVMIRMITQWPEPPEPDWAPPSGLARLREAGNG